MKSDMYAGEIEREIISKAEPLLGLNDFEINRIYTLNEGGNFYLAEFIHKQQTKIKSIAFQLASSKELIVEESSIKKCNVVPHTNQLVWVWR